MRADDGVQLRAMIKEGWENGPPLPSETCSIKEVTFVEAKDGRPAYRQWRISIDLPATVRGCSLDFDADGCIRSKQEQVKYACAISMREAKIGGPFRFAFAFAVSL